MARGAARTRQKGWGKPQLSRAPPGGPAPLGHDGRVPPLPDLLKDSTRDLHARAERSGAMGALLRGQLSRAGYARLLQHLHLLYAELEARLAAAGTDPLLQPLALPGLARSAALAADRAALGADDAAAPPAPALQAYLARLHAATPAQLAAHVYVRYLGDLNGGRMLARLVAQRYAPAAPTAFYDFGPPETAAALRDGLRAALAALPLAPGAAEAIAAEARWAFEAHVRLFEELAEA